MFGYIRICLVIYGCFSAVLTSAQINVLIASEKLWESAKVHKKKGNYINALANYQAAYGLVASHYPIRAANLCVEISDIYYNNGDTKNAIATCLNGLKHLKSFKTAPDSTVLKLCFVLGELYRYQSKIDSCLKYFYMAEQAIVRSPLLEAKMPQYVVYYYNSKGQLYLLLQEYHQSEIYFQKANQLANQYNLQADVPYVSSGIAEYYDLMGQHKQAYFYRNEALRLYSVIDSERAAYMSGLSWTLYKLKQYEAAIVNSKKVLQFLQKLPNAHSGPCLKIQMKQYWFVGACLFSLKKYQESEKNIDYALRFYDTNFSVKNENLGNLYLLKAQLRVQKKDYNQALANLKLAVSIVLTTQNQKNISPLHIKYPQLALLITVYIAQVWQKKYEANRSYINLFEAINAYDLAMQVYQLSGRIIDEKQTNLTLADRNYSLLQNAITLGFEAYRQYPHRFKGVLFRWFEAQQANFLNETLRVQKIKKRTLLPHIIEQEKQIETDLILFRNKMPIDSVAYNDLQVRRYQFKQLLMKQYPSYYQNFYQISSFDLHQLQQKLDSKTAYLAYTWVENNLYTMIVTHHMVDFKVQIMTPKWAESLSHLKKQLSLNPGMGRYEGRKSAVYCYRQLIEPIKKHLIGKEHLVVCRDYQFQFLPLEILETGNKQNDFLFKQYAIGYTYSAQSYWGQLPNDDLKSDQISNKTKPILFVTPFLSGFRNGNQLWESVGNSKEVKTIGGEEISDQNATKKKLKEVNLYRKILNISTHAFADTVDGFNSYLQMYPNEDDRLYFADICLLRMQNTSLVVLGACETDKGKSMKGEGVLSLARAFFYAGAKSVVSTSWEANNEALSLMSVSLNKYLKEGQKIDKALQMARLEIINSGQNAKFNHPYYWANLTLLGNNNAIYDKPFGLLFYLFLSLIFCLLGGVIWLKLKVKK